MLYLESPIGVGYSYTTDESEYDHVGDGSVAEDNKLALIHFLDRFPEYKKRDFYVTGESYAGKYIPRLLSLRPRDVMFKSILKGGAIGNGYFSEKFDYNSRLFYANYHGLIGPTQWDELITSCCQNCTEKCDFYNVDNNDVCALHSEDVISQLWMDGLNIYNIYQDCALSGSMEHFKSFLMNNFPEKIKNRMKANKKFKLTPTCTDDKLILDFMNNPDVQNAIHVSKTPLGSWTLCSNTIFNKYQKRNKSMKYFLDWFWRNHPEGRILLYAGDMDMACNFIGVQEFAASLKRPITHEYTNWMYEKNHKNQQIGGFMRRWDGLTFATVRGAGHMVPTDRPASSFHLFSHFIKGKW
jgi:cathepsin A (carboxypeptidase C)